MNVRSSLNIFVHGPREEKKKFFQSYTDNFFSEDIPPLILPFPLQHVFQDEGSNGLKIVKFVLNKGVALTSFLLIPHF